MINIVIPMAGLGSRFSEAGYEKPKSFIDVAGKVMIARVIENLRCEDARFILLAREEHLREEITIVKQLKKEFDVIFVPIDKTTEGTACTVLFARKYINNEEPLLIANSDQIVDIDMNDFVRDCMKRNLDGSIMTFIDPHRDPKWSFAKIDDNGIVKEVKEKSPISEHATVGIYFYSKGRDFVNAALDMIINNDRVNNEFYTCPAYNYAIKDKGKIGIYEVNFLKMHGLGTPGDLNEYLEVLV